jgi:hypothetical protein
MYKILLITTILNLGLTIEAAARKSRTAFETDSVADKALYIATANSLQFSSFLAKKGYYTKTADPMREFIECMHNPDHKISGENKRAFQDCGLVPVRDGYEDETAKIDADVRRVYIQETGMTIETSGTKPRE